MSGRKRHIIVDTTGWIPPVCSWPWWFTQPTSRPFGKLRGDGAKLVLAKLLGRFPRLQVIWADAAYAGRLVKWAWATGGWLLQVVRRRPDGHQFEVLPRRWVVDAPRRGSAGAGGSARTK